ncbi:MAG: glycosyltransferase family 39 protein [Candidatus Shapirobacteria bacterium]|jgi:4-amino-4-deoxy-L-arabinose transferase-like glycosyltransferase
MFRTIFPTLRYSAGSFLLPVILLFALIARLANLNYNSPFNDEAIYSVVGKLALYQGDWWSYNAKSWMGGHPYIYPTLSAAATIGQSMVGPRLLNVVFGVLSIEMVYVLTKNLAVWQKLPYPNLAALISALIIAFSSVSLYISRLATYDTPSYYFLLLSLVFLVQALPANSGKNYFLAAILLLLSFFTKIIVVIYIPFIILFSFLAAKKSKKTFNLYLRYYLAPIILGFAGYFLVNISAILTFTSNQATRAPESSARILSYFFQLSAYHWIFWSISSLGFFIVKKTKLWALLTALSFLVLLFHLGTNRLATLDKHLFFTFCFLSVAIGIGISSLLASLKSQILRYSAISLFIYLGFFFFKNEFAQKSIFERQWLNASPMLAKLAEVVQNGDKVLTEGGATTIWSLYPVNSPFNITTFDWFEYQNLTGDYAYLQAIKDGYFDYIELDGQAEWRKSLTDQIFTVINQNYQKIYTDNNFSIYERNY